MDSPQHDSPTVRAAAEVSTPNASRYLQQLCKHFGHKVPVEFNPHTGHITFSFGECRLKADETTLTMSIAAPDEARAAQTQDVITNHLARFAFREEPLITWRATGTEQDNERNAGGLSTEATAVLETYHARIRDERAARRQTPEGGPVAGRDQRLLAVGPDTGALINILAKSLKAPTILELGTSYGYSGIWLADAARATGGRLITVDLHEHKSAYAREMAEKAGLADHIDFRVGDALQVIAELAVKVDFVLVDLWKDLYVPCLEAFYPALNPGAIIVADNMLRPGGEHVDHYGRAVRARPGMSSVLLPVGSGLEVSRYEPA